MTKIGTKEQCGKTAFPQGCNWISTLLPPSPVTLTFSVHCVNQLDYLQIHTMESLFSAKITSMARTKARPSSFRVSRVSSWSQFPVNSMIFSFRFCFIYYIFH